MPVPKFSELEEQMLARWDEERVFEKSLEKTQNGETFVFFEGPPTANGKPGLHHIIARAFKDAIPRYQTMRGRRVDRKAGWDTHGLPVELQVEKALGISGKPQIENLVAGDARASIIKFNEECKKNVWTYLDEWTRLTRRMGYWLDLEKPYITYENNYIESLWSVLKRVHERGLLYQGFKVVHQCPRCGTALSSHEVAQGYKNVKEDSVFLKFKVVGQKNTYLLCWTTTPWTLPGNVALAVGADVDYAKVKVGDDIYILAEGLVDSVLIEAHEVIEKIKGANLVGWEYEPLFPYLVDGFDSEQRVKAFKIYAADFVTTIDGTGIVHIAVMYGEDDYQLGLKVGLPVMHTVGEDGNFLSIVTPWAGKFVKATETEKAIIADLETRGLLLKTQPYEHDYPFCWRCGTPLLYYAKDAWFIRMSELTDKLVENNSKINWVPEHIKEGRFGEWLRHIKDWAISRERYWGTPLPIWKCDQCYEFEVIGSVAELEKKSGVKLFDLHRPYVDDPNFSCACGGLRIRVKEVMDVWFDSGAMFVAQWGYRWGEDGVAKKNFSKHFPAEYIAEAIDQTRGWFYTLLAVATLLKLDAPYKNVICIGHILDSKGQKMSKSKGNVIDPWDLFSEFGADAVRWFMYSASQAGDSKLFDKQGLREVIKKIFLILWNVLEFYKLNTDNAPTRKMGATGAAVSDFFLAQNHQAGAENSPHPLDLWMDTRLQNSINFVTTKLDSYEFTDATREINDLIIETSTWYVRRSRERMKGDSAEARAAQEILRATLETIAKLMAPFAPMIADALYRELGNTASVHLADWPSIVSVDEKILQNMSAARALVTQALEQRAAAGIPVRQVLSVLTVPESAGVFENLFEILRAEVNVEEIKVGKLLVLDTMLTPALKEKGLVRELVRRINAARKDAGLKAGEPAIAVVSGDEHFATTLAKHGEEINRQTVCAVSFLGVGEFLITITSDHNYKGNNAADSKL